MSRYEKQKSNAGSKAVIVIALLLAAIMAGYVTISLVFGSWNPATWTEIRREQMRPDGEQGDNQPDKDPELPGQDKAPGGAEIGESEGHGVTVASAILPREAYEAYGISPQADTAYTLVATVTPEDAVNKQLYWTVRWENPRNTWSSGKEVTDYLQIMPTAEGSATATATCMQAFGEPVLITAKVLDTDNLTATCTAHYVQQFSGRDFNMTMDNGTTNYSWSFAHTNTNPTIDLPQSTSSLSWMVGLGDNEHTTRTGQVHMTTVYTKTNSPELGVESFCVTSDYINALRAAGLTPKVEAEEYVQLKSNTSFCEVYFTLVANQLPSAASNWSAYRTSLKNNASKVMFRIKTEVLLSNGTTRETIYNVRFNASSLTTVATNITMDKTELNFGG